MIATGRPAPTPARDSLRTLALVHALYRSIDAGEAQEVGAQEVGAP